MESFTLIYKSEFLPHDNYAKLINGSISVFDSKTKILKDCRKLSDDIDFISGEFKNYSYYQYVEIIEMYNHPFMFKDRMFICVFALKAILASMTSGSPPYIVYMVDMHGRLEFSHGNTQCNSCNRIMKDYGVNIECREIENIDMNDIKNSFKIYNELEIISCFTGENLFKIPLYKYTNVYRDIYPVVNIIADKKILVQLRGLENKNITSFIYQLSLESRYRSLQKYKERPMGEYYKKTPIILDTLSSMKRINKYICAYSMNNDKHVLAIYDSNMDVIHKFNIPNQIYRAKKISENEVELFDFQHKRYTLTCDGKNFVFKEDKCAIPKEPCVNIEDFISDCNLFGSKTSYVINLPIEVIDKFRSEIYGTLSLLFFPVVLSKMVWVYY